MIRVGQMMVANALVRVSKIRIESESEPSTYYFLKNKTNRDKLESEVISLFLDTVKSPFSVHNIAEEGSNMFHKIIGDWFGTNSVSHVLKLLNKVHRPYEDFEIVVFKEGMVEMNQIFDAVSEVIEEENEHLVLNPEESKIKEAVSSQVPEERGEKEASFETSFPNSSSRVASSIYTHSTQTFNRLCRESIVSKDTFRWEGKLRKWTDKYCLIIVNVQLGMKKVPDCYFDTIESLFRIEYCVGIMGGKGSMALYFPGCQDHKLIVLDPHYV